MRDKIKTIKEHIARAKAYAGRMDVIKTLDSLAAALKVYLVTPAVGRDKAEIEILFAELMRTLNGMSQMKSLFPSGLSFKRGQEKQFLELVTKTNERIRSAIGRAEVSKVRTYKNSIDKAILAGQKLLEEKNLVEARKIFRRASEEFASEPGVFQDIGSRLLMAGMVQESVEYLERAIETAPRDPRPYGFLVAAYEALGELEKAEVAVKNALKNFGPSDRIYLRMAKLYLKMKRWDDAYNSAEAALSLNPLSREAKKVMDQVEPRIFGGRRVATEPPTYNI
jgi:tetratricopeptide (TPR) repeat protein